MARFIFSSLALALATLLAPPILAEDTPAPAATSQPGGEGEAPQPSEARRAARSATRVAARAARAAALAAAEAARAAAQVAVEAAEAAASESEDPPGATEKAVREAEEAAERAAKQAEKAAEAAERAAEQTMHGDGADSQPATRPDDDDDDDGDDDDERAGHHHQGHKCSKDKHHRHGHDEAPCEGSCAGDNSKGFCSGSLCLEPGVRLRVRYDAIEDDAAVSYIGRNDGFGLSSARFKLRGRHGDWLRFNLGLEGGFVEQTDSNVVAGRTFMALKDAWLDVRPFDFFQVRVGQFKTPFNLESWRSTSTLRFVDRSVGDRGIRVGEGYQTLGVSPDRDLGVMVGSQEFEVGPVSLLYLASATNGNGTNQAFNDNSFPALHGRLELGLWDVVKIGGGALYNPRSIGVLPNLYDETDLGFTADAQVAVFGAFLDASLMWVNTAYPTTGAPDSSAMAVSVEAGYLLWFGLGAGYRFAWYDPTSVFDYDAVMEHSVGVRYNLPGMPVALILDYTIALEQPGRELTNNRLAGLVQLDI